MSHKVIRNQSAFIFPISLADGVTGVFTLGPLQPGEFLEELVFDLYCVASETATATVEIAVSDSPISAGNFSADATPFTFNGIPISLHWELFRTLLRTTRIPINRYATDRERFFSVRLINVDLVGVLTGFLAFSVTYDPVAALSV